MKKKTTIIIEFDNKKAAHHFAVWLCESGEQDYWQWMECREEDEESGNITAVSFEYKTKAKNDPERYGEFMCDNTIRTVAGRLDHDGIDKAADDEE